MSLSVDIECEFSSKRSDYLCEVTNDIVINSQETATVNNVTGNHEQGESNNDVNYFYAYHKTIEYFPKGLPYFFPNNKC